jgi:hypothetical protein
MILVSRTLPALVSVAAIDQDTNLIVHDSNTVYIHHALGSNLGFLKPDGLASHGWLAFGSARLYLFLGLAALHGVPLNGSSRVEV